MDTDRDFLSMADVARSFSPDPNTKVGAVIVKDGKVISVGYNAFPRGIANTDERWQTKKKYHYVVHAEHNAILSAAEHGRSTYGSILYLVGMGPPTVPCVSCAKAIINAGIVGIVGTGYKPPTDNWHVSLSQAQELLEEAGVRYREFPYEDLRREESGILISN